MIKSEWFDKNKDLFWSALCDTFLPSSRVRIPQIVNMPATFGLVWGEVVLEMIDRKICVHYALSQFVKDAPGEIERKGNVYYMKDRATVVVE